MLNQSLRKQSNIYSALYTGSLLKRPLVRVCKHGNLSNVETDEFYELCLVAVLINLLSSELLDEMGTKFQLQFVITCMDNLIQCRHSKYADFVKISSNVKLNTSSEKNMTIGTRGREIERMRWRVGPMYERDSLAIGRDLTDLLY